MIESGFNEAPARMQGKTASGGVLTGGAGGFNEAPARMQGKTHAIPPSRRWRRVLQ